MTTTAYELLPMFCVRLAGRPFDHLEKLRLQQTLPLARELLTLDEELVVAAKLALDEIRANPAALSAAARNKVGQALGLRQALPPERSELAAIEAYRTRYAAREEHLGLLQKTLEAEFAQAREALIGTVAGLIKPYAVFAASEINERIDQALEKGTDGAFDRRARERERHLLMYLQRICAKNETISEFGPTAWGHLDPEVEGLRFSAQKGILRRDVYLEKWVVEGVADAMNQDPEVRMELSPRRHPFGRIDGDRFVRDDLGAERTLAPQELELLTACDGRTPCHELGSENALAALAETGAIIWRVEPVTLDPHRMERLAEDIRAWRPSPARERWLDVAERLLAAARAFGEAVDVNERFLQMQVARDVLGSLSVTRKEGRALYSAHNPIGEDTVREVDFALGSKPAAVLVDDAGPWFDLWRDTFAYAASKWGEALAERVRDAPRVDGRVLLPGFLSHLKARGLPMTAASYARSAEKAFAEVRALLSERFASRPDAEEWELSAEDCHVVRNKLSFTPFEELSWPSADLVLSAASAEAVAKGDYQWLVAELHASNAMLQNAMMWGCPDLRRLGEVCRRGTGATPFFYIAGGDDTCHTTLRAYDVVPDQWTCVSPNRPRSDYQVVDPSRAEVVLDERGPDVRLRAIDDGRDLGSFVRHWGVAANGFHPFLFVLRPHMPRLRMGKVVVQRQYWTVSVHDSAGGPYQGLSARLVAAMDRLRSDKGLPRFIYARPTIRPSAEGGGRDKDAKPVFVDFESYHSLDVFQHALTKHGEMEVSEMLPSPEQMLWREQDGRYTYELRTLIGPRPR